MLAAYDWPDDVLARLLALNAEPAEAERLAGLSAPPSTRATNGDEADQNTEADADGSGHDGDEASSPSGPPRSL